MNYTFAFTYTRQILIMQEPIEIAFNIKSFYNIFLRFVYFVWIFFIWHLRYFQMMLRHQKTQKKISDENNYKYSKKGKWGDNLYCDYDLPLCVTFLYFLCYLGIWENILLYVVMDIYAILVKLCFHWAIVKTACDCNHWRWIFMIMILSKMRNLVCKN